ncbi:MAG: hypothetical protein HY209_05800 [Candidatus Omnitrophica bacterium]|nr:hypothetical protein [Candidatus Omnitrophota bacterium]
MISPEERLFDAIQEGKKYPAGKKINPAQGLKSFLEGLTFKWRPSDLAAGGQRINLAAVTKILFIILVALIMLVFYNVTRQRPSLSKLTAGVSTGGAQLPGPKPIEEFNPVTVYLDEAKKRDLFHPIPPPAPPTPVVSLKEKVKPAATAVDLRALIKNLTLSGIYQGQDVEVMVEDKTTKKTYFLKQGDEVKGMKVKAILKDRVILQLGTQEIELL